MSALHRDEIAARLESLPGWRQRGNALEKHFDRGDFDGAIRFVDAIAVAANMQNHHPNLTIAWSDVAVALTSHDAGGITARDFRLAATIDEIARREATS
ncbi:MAG: 4a-hydroxytetrahydrobiopterin dehydratase [Vulcanimicrobiaceae bacterium]